MPPVTRALLIANVAVFFLQMNGFPLLDTFALWPPASAGDLESPGFAPWQLVTYSFLHGGFSHILFNMFGLYMFGSEIERVFGSRYFAAYYFASVVAAGLTHLVMTTLMGGPAIPIVGASGGIYGLLLAFGVYFPQRRIMLLIPPIPMTARTFVVVFAVLELFFGVTGTVSGVAHFAHLGGMLGGWAMIEYRKRAGPSKRW
jgi:membrane associated rhomboid family serine protease